MESHLLKRWSENESGIPILDEASVTLVRDQAKRIGSKAGLSERETQEFLIVVSELAQNQLRHALSGEIILRETFQFGTSGIEAIAFDHGPGIPDPEAALSGTTPADERSLKGGLAAAYRLSDLLDIDTRLGEGTCIRAKKFATPPAWGWEAAIFGKPFPGELRSGDDGSFGWLDGQYHFAVADGFGHGADARKSSEAAIQGTLLQHDQTLSHVLSSLNQRLSEMRGTMLTLGRLGFPDRSLDWACIGDVSATLYHDRQSFQPSCRDGRILGDGNAHPFLLDFERIRVHPGDLLILHTDGIREALGEISEDLELRRRPAIVIAQRILETFERGNDDALILVLRFALKGSP